jgi:deazaflavin-dependent oxidoreductase (nitroreductase family)
MPARSFDDAHVFHRAMCAFAAIKAGRVFFRPTAHRLDQLVSKLTVGQHRRQDRQAPHRRPSGRPTPRRRGRRRGELWRRHHPAWYHNLKANPAASVTIEGDTCYATARLATPVEREKIWASGVEIYPGLEKEEVWAGDRHIEVFVFVLTRN